MWGVWGAVDWVVCAAVEGAERPCRCDGADVCSPVTISTTTSRATTPTAARGPPSRRGRWLMECMARSPLPVMKLPGGRSGPTSASSKVTASSALGTGGGGTGGTTVCPGSVSRTVEEPETRTALAGKWASPFRGCWPSEPD